MAELRPVISSPRRERQARAFFDSAASLFGALGLPDAERSIRHYRDGTGTDIRLTGRDIARHPLIDLGVRANRSRFETLTLPGRANKANNDRLLRLRDGETVSLEDKWSRDFNF